MEKGIEFSGPYRYNIKDRVGSVKDSSRIPEQRWNQVQGTE